MSDVLTGQRRASLTRLGIENSDSRVRGASRQHDTPDWRRLPRFLQAATATTALLLVVLSVAGCSGDPRGPGIAGGGQAATATPSSAAGSGDLAKLLAYATCMRDHGIADFPDPEANPGGPGGSFSYSAGPGSNLNPNNPKYKAADKACQSLMPGGSLAPAQSAQKNRLRGQAGSLHEVARRPGLSRSGRQGCLQLQQHRQKRAAVSVGHEDMPAAGERARANSSRRREMKLLTSGPEPRRFTERFFSARSTSSQNQRS